MQPERRELVLEPGSTLGGYAIERLLGSGGMGVVVSARRLADDERVALKVPSGRHGIDPSTTRRLLREAESVKRLKNRHTARLLDVELVDEVPVLVLELLEGRDLAALLREDGRQPARRACAFVLQACEAVREAHQLGIVHRDLKPSNLFVLDSRDHRDPADTPMVKVLDFGLSKAFGTAADLGDDSTLTGSEAVVGSPRYMAPEVVRDAAVVDPRCDVWSLGVVLYELIAGEPPFSAATVAGVLARIVADPFEPLSRRGIEVPEELEALIARALEKDPERRFPSMGELMDALRPHAERSDTLGGAVGTVAAEPESPSRSGRAWLATLIAAAIGASFVAYRATRVDSDRDRPAAAQPSQKVETHVAPARAAVAERADSPPASDPDPLPSKPAASAPEAAPAARRAVAPRAKAAATTPERPRNPPPARSVFRPNGKVPLTIQTRK